MILFYSGCGDKHGPEEYIGHKANVMLTFFSNQNKPNSEYRMIMAERKKNSKKFKAARKCQRQSIRKAQKL